MPYHARTLIVFVEASARHCSNDCPQMTTDAKRCTLYNKDLTWDPKKKCDGNKRLLECKRAEKDYRSSHGH
jgi:hypothetical protein